MKEPVIEYSSAIDTQGRTTPAAGILGTPHVMLIDPQGIVRWQGLRALEGNGLTGKVVKELLERH